MALFDFPARAGTSRRSTAFVDCEVVGFVTPDEILGCFPFFSTVAFEVRTEPARSESPLILLGCAHRVQASEIFIVRMDFSHLPLNGKCRDQP